ncbi:MAG: HAMP domain-containing histidine kinase [Bacteriovoracaceae bacterium]|nr:HAMP domain-containing histidine kinase [Bacteriovoracaceae bacterium]
MYELLRGLMDLYQYSAEDKEITFEVTAAPELKNYADRVRITQALGNLIDNALKFSPKGSTVRLEAFESEGSCIIKIQDQGMGIEAEDLERIWDRLYRGDKSRSTTGLGIGLSVVKAIVKAHQGSIVVESTPKKGSVFIISLPRCNTSERKL